MISGDFEKLREISRTLRLAGSPAFRLGLAKQLAASAKLLVANQFKTGTNPYGQPWAPLKAQRRRQGSKKRSDVIGVNRGLMRNSLSAPAATIATDRGFRIGSDRFYAKFFNSGTKHSPARLLFPKDGAVGKIWGGKFETATLEYFKRFFGRVR